VCETVQKGGAPSDDALAVSGDPRCLPRWWYTKAFGSILNQGQEVVHTDIGTDLKSRPDLFRHETLDIGVHRG